MAIAGMTGRNREEEATTGTTVPSGRSGFGALRSRHQRWVMILGLAALMPVLVLITVAAITVAQSAQVPLVINGKLNGDGVPVGWELAATGYYYLDFNNMALAGIVIRPTPDLLRLQQEIIEVLVVYGAPIRFDNLVLFFSEQPAQMESNLFALRDQHLISFYKSKNIEYYSIRSNGFKQTIYSLLPENTRNNLHSNILAFAQKNLSFEMAEDRLAYHHLQAGISKEGLNYASKAYKKLTSMYSYRYALELVSLFLLKCQDQPRRVIRLFERRSAQLYELTGDNAKALAHYYNILPFFRNGVAKAALLRHISALYYKLGETEKAKKALDDALCEIRNNYVEKALILREKSWIAALEGQHQEAIQFGERALDELKNINSSALLARMLHNLGIANYYASNMEKAINLFQQSIELKKKLSDEYGYAAALNNLGVLYNTLGRYEQAFAIWSDGLNIQEQIGDIHGQAETLHNLGILFMIKGEYSRAYHFFLKSRDLMNRLGNIRGIVQLTSSLSDLDYYHENFESAIEKCDEALKFSKRINGDWSIAKRPSPSVSA